MLRSPGGIELSVECKLLLVDPRMHSADDCRPTVVLDKHHGIGVMLEHYCANG